MRREPSSCTGLGETEELRTGGRSRSGSAAPGQRAGPCWASGVAEEVTSTVTGDRLGSMPKELVASCPGTPISNAAHGTASQVKPSKLESALWQRAEQHHEKMRQASP